MLHIQLKLSIICPVDHILSLNWREYFADIVFHTNCCIEMNTWHLPQHRKMKNRFVPIYL